MPKTPDAVLITYPNATLVEIKQNFAVFPKSGGGVRGSISGFSPASRTRLNRLLNRIEASAWKRCKFVTLTYHKNQRDHAEAKYHLKRFTQQLRRYHPDHAGVWKLEYQDRGSIHFHVLTFGRYIHHKEIAHSWNRIAEPGNHKHRDAGTQIVPVHQARNAVAYVAKYCGKLVGGGEGSERRNRDVEGNGSRGSSNMQHAGAYTGRFWGVFNKRALPLARGVAVALDGRTASQAIEYYRASLSLGANAKSSVSIFTRTPRESEDISNKIRGMSHDDSTTSV